VCLLFTIKRPISKITKVYQHTERVNRLWILKLFCTNYPALREDDVSNSHISMYVEEEAISSEFRKQGDVIHGRIVGCVMNL